MEKKEMGKEARLSEYSCAAGSSSIIRFYSWNYTATIV